MIIWGNSSHNSKLLFMIPYSVHRLRNTFLCSCTMRLYAFKPLLPKRFCNLWSVAETREAGKWPAGMRLAFMNDVNIFTTTSCLIKLWILVNHELAFRHPHAFEKSSKLSHYSSGYKNRKHFFFFFIQFS